MADADELAQLIQRLSRVSSPLERMKTLARAWRSLRRLSPGQRKDLAARVGIADGADLIERLAGRRGGLNPGMVQRALEKIRSSDPGEIRSAIRGLRDPDRRKELLSQGLDAASDVVSRPEVAEDPGEPGTEPPAPVPATAAATAAATVAAAAIPPPVRTARRVPSAGASKPAPRWARPRPEPPAEPSAVPVGAVEPQSAPPAPMTRGERVAASGRARPAPVAGRLLERVEDETMLIHKFRVLRRHVGEARGMNARQLRELLERFPSGWGRRRALDALLENAIPDSLNKAIFLIEQLESEIERRWCVSTLLHQWKLTDEEKQLLAERHGMFRGAPAARS